MWRKDRTATLRGFRARIEEEEVTLMEVLQRCDEALMEETEQLEDRRLKSLSPIPTDVSDGGASSHATGQTAPDIGHHALERSLPPIPFETNETDAQQLTAEQEPNAKRKASVNEDSSSEPNLLPAERPLPPLPTEDEQKSGESKKDHSIEEDLINIKYDAGHKVIDWADI